MCPGIKSGHCIPHREGPAFRTASSLALSVFVTRSLVPLYSMVRGLSTFSLMTCVRGPPHSQRRRGQGQCSGLDQGFYALVERTYIICAWLKKRPAGGPTAAPAAAARFATSSRSAYAGDDGLLAVSAGAVMLAHGVCVKGRCPEADAIFLHQGACSVVWGDGRSRAKHVCALGRMPLPSGEGASMPLNSIALAAVVAFLHRKC